MTYHLLQYWPLHLAHNVIFNFIKSFLKNLCISKEAKHKKLSSFYGFLSFWNALELEDQMCSSLLKKLLPFYNLFFLLVQGSLDYYWLSCLIYIKDARNDDRFFCSCITSSNR